MFELLRRVFRLLYKLLPVGLVFLLVLGAGVMAYVVSHHNVAIVSPQGDIGYKERNLLVIAILLSAIVVLPVYAMTIVIATRYRESNHKKKRLAYRPDWDHSRLFEGIWWGVPIAIIGVLSVITWQSSHSLNPWKSIASHQKSLTIQVIALDWKWLFIYPGQHIASVNMAEFPENTPVDFHLTSDTVMNSFWVPGLGGQIYVMPGMHTQLHELARHPATFFGSPANIAGKGYARMDFTLKSVSANDFNAWIRHAQRSPKALDASSYAQLARPSDNVPPTYYSHADSNLFTDVVEKYLIPPGSPTIIPHLHDGSVQ